MSRRGTWLLAMLGGLLLGFAAPPAVVPFGEWLVLPGLAAWFVLATSSEAKLRHSYLLGCIYMAWFSWSVRHILLPAYFAIVVVGGLYFVLGTAAVRGAPRRGRAVAFAVAVAGTFWLRAMMPDIYYPHGQPSHCLWQYPFLMRVVTVGGEPLMNAVLALVAATGVGACASWRTGKPAWRPSVSAFAASVVSFLGLAVVGSALGSSVARPATEAAAVPALNIAAVEPGFHPMHALWQAPSRQAALEVVEQRLFAPTAELLRRAESPAAAFDLVLWPESSLALYQPVLAADIESGRASIFRGHFATSDTRLVIGGAVQEDGGSGPAALLLDLAVGRVTRYQPKQRLVPGGEFLPLVGLLPEAWADSIRLSFEDALGTPANCLAGGARPPMTTASGVPFGALLCYDNAFYGPAAEHVAAGAQLLVVLSNETWYRGGAELTQLVAMTVVRALENAVPVVRCTMDGHSVAVDADGRVVAGLPIAPAPQPQARILEVSVAPGTGRVPPMAWLRRSCGWLLALFTALGAAHSTLRWVRIRSARTALSAAAGSGSSGDGSGGS